MKIPVVIPVDYKIFSNPFISRDLGVISIPAPGTISLTSTKHLTIPEMIPVTLENLTKPFIPGL